jgi:hypothetical protein
MQTLSEIKWLIFIAKTDEFIPRGEVLFIRPYFSQGGGGFGGLKESEAISYELRSETAYGAIKEARSIFQQQTTCDHEWEHDEWASGEPFTYCEKCDSYGGV